MSTTRRPDSAGSGDGRDSAGQEEVFSQPEASPCAEDIFNSMRKIVRAISLHNHSLTTRSRFTVPQLVCLRRIMEAGSIGPSELAKRVFLSQATVTGIVDRLEAKGLVQRERTHVDRRRVLLTLTEKGLELAKSQPLPLQDIFASRLAALPLEDQEEIRKVMGRVATMMETAETRKSAARQLAGEEVVPGGHLLDF